MSKTTPAAPEGFAARARAAARADLESPMRAGDPREQELEEATAEIARLRTELAATNAEIAGLKERVAKLERRLGWTNEIDTPHAPVRPYGDMGPGGPGSGP